MMRYCAAKEDPAPLVFPRLATAPQYQDVSKEIDVKNEVV